MIIIVLDVCWIIFYCSNHGLWIDSFHNEYFMVLPYLKVSFLYVIVLFIVNVLVSFDFNSLYLIFYGLLSLISIKVYYKNKLENITSVSTKISIP
jgi:hypothetical protein